MDPSLFITKKTMFLQNLAFYNAPKIELYTMTPTLSLLQYKEVQIYKIVEASFLMASPS